MLKIDILTLIPTMFTGPFDESMVKRAREKGLVEISIHNLRQWARDKHKTVDDRPFGGGKGMVIRVDVVATAITDLKFPISNEKKRKVVLLSPQGKTFNQGKARELAGLDHLILLAGHYEGFDERITEHLVDEELSIGDYVLTGGELPVMVVTDAVVRLVKGVLEKEATEKESFAKTDLDGRMVALLDYPQYTKPVKFGGWEVPEILLSGNHAEIDKWRQVKALNKTMKNRPDLLKGSA